MPKQVIVVGAGLGGLSAAIRARLHGHDVLVVESRAMTGGKAASVEEFGYRFDPGPSIVILTQIYQALFRDAGRQLEDYVRFRPLNPITRLYMGSSAPLDLPAGRPECVRLVREAAPGDARAFEALLRKLDQVAPVVEGAIFGHAFDSPLQLADPALIRFGLPFDFRKTYRQMVDGWFQSELLRAFFYGFPSYSGQTYDSKAPGALMIPYFMIRDGVVYPEGGVSAIPRAFEALARELGAEFQMDSPVAGLLTEGKRVKGVRLAGGEPIQADAVISNVDRSTTRTWLGIPAPEGGSFSYFTVQWGIRGRVRGLAHHTLIVPDGFDKGFDLLYRRRRFPFPPIVYLNETAGTDAEVAPVGATNLFAVVSTPGLEPGIDWEGEGANFKATVIAQIRAAGIEWSDSDVEVERIQTPITFRDTFGNHQGSLYGPEERVRLFGGMFPLRNYDEAFQNLFYCGGSVQPGAGLPMVALSGKFAVEAMQRRS